MSGLAIPQFQQVLDACQVELRAFAMRRLGSRAKAEEVVQEACLRIADLRNADVIENPRAYLYRVVGNLAVDVRRKERLDAKAFVRIDDADQVVDPAADAERGLIAKQRLALLAKAVAELPPRCRECFVLRRYDDLSADEIAKRMGISRNMVEKHLRLALSHCAKKLREGD